MKRVQGLENILSRCPNCNARYSIKTKGSKVLCQACSLEATVDDRYNFVGLKPFRNFADWYEWQTERIREQILENENYTLSARVVLKHASTDGKTLLRVAGEGECSLTRKGLTYVGTEDGNDIEKHFPISNIYRLLFGAGEDFEIYVGKDIYYFVPEEPRCCVDFYIASKIIKDEISD